jgi:hypothetical protein
MNTTLRRVPTRFEADTSFELAPASTPRRWGAQAAELDDLKNRLLRELLREAPKGPLATALRRAANEAAALVWLTPYPLLLLPALLEEKAQAARAQVERQQLIRRRSQVMLELVA